MIQIESSCLLPHYPLQGFPSSNAQSFLPCQRAEDSRPATQLPFARLRLEDQFAFFEIHRDAAVVGDLAADDLARKRCLDESLEETLQRTRSIDRVVAFPCDVFLGGIGAAQV